MQSKKIGRAGIVGESGSRSGRGGVSGEVGTVLLYYPTVDFVVVVCSGRNGS